jgi:predicted aspartyl protease
MTSAKKVCPSCGSLVLKEMRRCPQCKTNLIPDEGAKSSSPVATPTPGGTTPPGPSIGSGSVGEASGVKKDRSKRFFMSPLGFLASGLGVVVALLVVTEEMRRSNFSGILYPSTYGGTTVVTLQERYGVLEVPFSTSDGSQFYAVVDSGAADIILPSEVVTNLFNRGVLSRTDYIGKRLYSLADGSTVNYDVYSLNYIKVGDLSVRDVNVAVSEPNSGALLGQSFFKRFKSWSIDNQGRTLTIVPLK